jgi:hypothetical protein
LISEPNKDVRSPRLRALHAMAGPTVHKIGHKIGHKIRHMPDRVRARGADRGRC